MGRPFPCRISTRNCLAAFLLMCERAPAMTFRGTSARRLSAGSLAVGREGRYAAAAVEADIGEDRLRHFFVHEGDYYRVRRELRDSVLFAAHSLLKDPPFSRLDLISCRNVLIYLDRELQEQVCTTFHYALNPAGFLFIGASEHSEDPPR